MYDDIGIGHKAAWKGGHMATKAVHKRGKSGQKIACTDKAYTGDSSSFRWAEVTCRSCLKFRPADR